MKPTIPTHQLEPVNRPAFHSLTPTCGFGHVHVHFRNRLTGVLYVTEPSETDLTKLRTTRPEHIKFPTEPKIPSTPRKTKPRKPSTALTRALLAEARLAEANNQLAQLMSQMDALLNLTTPQP